MAIGGINPTNAASAARTVTNGVGGQASGAGPTGGATEAQGKSFGDAITEAVLKRPSESHHIADNMAARLAAGENIDPHKVALATAKASIEVQFATRGISQAVSGIRTLMQMQI